MRERKEKGREASAAEECRRARGLAVVERQNQLQKSKATTGAKARSIGYRVNLRVQVVPTVAFVFVSIQILARQCLSMCQNLRKNICGLPSDGTQRTEIDHQTVNFCILSELQYAFQFWAYHPGKCTDADNMMHSVLLLLQKHCKECNPNGIETPYPIWDPSVMSLTPSHLGLGWDGVGIFWGRAED